MRWYKIVAGGQTWDATSDPYALNVEMDIPVTVQNLPANGTGAFVRVWGIPLQTLLNAKQFNNQPISVYGGMQQGLPLANPSQQGLLVQGKCYPALGNWVGTDMTLDFFIVVAAGVPNPKRAANVIHNWKANTPLSQPIAQTIQTAFPGYTPIINISDKLKLNYDDTGFYQTLGQYARYIYNISMSIMGSTAGYFGVHMWTQGKNIYVSDATQPQQGGAGQIQFQDLIGQPIWTGINTIQFKTVMRGDINLLDTITLPPALATLTQGSATQVGGQGSNVIQGQFKILRMRHTGNFRQPDWPSWCTTFDAMTLNAQ